MKTLILSILQFVICALSVNAQTIQVSAPSHVAVGENFRISYTINTQDVSDFRAGNVPTGLEVIAGPYTSQQSSYQIVNGRTSRSSMVTYTYTLYADKAGSYTIPAAHAKVSGKSATSYAAHITVSSPAGHNSSGRPKMHDDSYQPAKTGGRISASDLFVKVSANKRRVHEQEPVVLTYKVYTLVDLTSLDGKMPDLTGFHTQEVALPQQKSFHIEKLNGRSYRCVTWSQYVMFPQMTGKLSIPSITFKGIVVQQNQDVDPFEAFFNGGSGYVEVKRSIVAPGLDIQVDPLPAKPAGYSGGVGKFSLSAKLNHTIVKEGNPIELRIVVGGIGNLKLIKQPAINAPKNFDKYDPKVTDKTQLTANGVEGNMIYDYVLVPRNRGEYTLPPVELTYYDVTSNAYKTLKTESLKVNVQKGDGRGTKVDSFEKNANTDIKPIMESRIPDNSGKIFFGTSSYWLLVTLMIASFVVVAFIYNRRQAEMSDIIHMRGKYANKMAVKRLKKAYALMKSQNTEKFYDEVLKALWGYVGDRLNIQVEQLSRENIAGKLKSRNIPQATIDKFLSALDECEFERYAPGDASGNMKKTYDYAMIAITDIEDVLRFKKKGNIAGKTLAICLLMNAIGIMGVCAVNEHSENVANDAYANGNYMEAIKGYEVILQDSKRSDIYYNIGNCYYRMGDISKSIIAYEKAQRLAPGNNDIAHNLDLARSKTIDKITPTPEMFFATWYKSLLNMNTIDEWGIMGLVALFLALTMISAYWLLKTILLRKISFYMALLMIVTFLLANVFGWQQKQILENRTRAVITTPVVSVKKTPSDTSSDAFVVHEGTGMEITDNTMEYWYGVRFADGREGWLKKNQVEQI